MLRSIVATFENFMGSSLSQQSAEDTVSQWLSQPHELIFDSGRREIDRYLEAVYRLQQSPKGKGIDDLIAKVMARLGVEFHKVLRRYSQAPAPPSTNEWSSVTDSTAYTFRYEDYTISDPPSGDVINYLRRIAERMNCSKRVVECVKVYKSVRKPFLQAQLKPLRFEELSVGSNKKRYVWDELKVKMEVWIQVSKICIRILFDREKQICDRIFGGIGDGVVKDECFVGTVHDFAFSLFGFVEALIVSNRPYERMEMVFGVYDAFLWVLPHADALFASEQGKEIRNKYMETLTRIQSEVGRMLHDFQHKVLHEVSISSDDRGVVDRSTGYVVEQIELIARHRELLGKLIKCAPSLDFDKLVIPQEMLGDVNGRSFIDLHLILIIVVLQKNLEIKAKSYKNSTLGQLFVMNNLHHVVLKIETSEVLPQMIGEWYMNQLNEKLRLAKASYQESICSKFLRCFREEGLYVTWFCIVRPSKTAFRKRLNDFNSTFEETQSLQCQWTIPDRGLREEICRDVLQTLVLAYGSFLDKFSSNAEIKSILEKNQKYTAEDLEVLVSVKLFSDAEVVV